MGDVRIQILTAIRAVWRRRWIVMIVAWAFCVFGWIGVLAMPDSYQSKTRIYVDSQSLLAPLLRGITVATNLDQQIEYMKQTLLSRPNLLQVVRMTDLDLTVQTESEMEGLISKLSGEIEVRSQGNDLFTIAYMNKDPKLAQRVVQSLVNIFVENNLGENRSDMEKARAFLDAQIAQYERQLRDSERRLAEFKRDNIELTAGKGSYFEKAQGARKTLETVTADYQDAAVARDKIAQQLATIPQFVEVNANPQVVVNNAGANTPLGALEQSMQTLQRSIDQMLGQYTEFHPDVVAARRSLEHMRKQHEEMEQDELARIAEVAADRGGDYDATTGMARMPNPLYEQIKLRLVESEATVASRKRRVEKAQSELDRLERLAVTAPSVEARFADLNRDYGVIKKNYEQLLARRESARIAQAVDAESDIQFRIVDPPEVPNIPVGPNRPLFMSMVIVAAIGGGIALAYLLAQMDVTISTAVKLREVFGLPVLGAVSTVAARGRRNLRALEIAGFAAVGVGLFAAYGGLLLFAPDFSIDLGNLAQLKGLQFL